MVTVEKRAEIADELARLEGERGVRVLYACESGSRAWGFESVDSDYDVRFIYLHPPAWYLTIAPGRDVIELPVDDELDISGWDLKKALGLLRKSNPPLLEWLDSPVVYREDPGFVAGFRALVPAYFSPRASTYHYLSMARNNFREHMRGAAEVKLKKYLYILRPVLGCGWLEAGLGPVPMRFETLVERLVEEPPLRAAIDALVARKKRETELGRGPAIPEINAFIEAELERLLEGARELPAAGDDSAAALDAFFLGTLRRYFPEY